MQNNAMTENNKILELDEMRSQMDELKSMLKEQTIINDRMMRKAMKGKYNKVRIDIKMSIFIEIISIPVIGYLLPLLGMPMWFSVITILFLLTALVASLYALRNYASGDLFAGNLTDVALSIVRYKRFGIYWFFYAIPFLVIWIFLFFRFLTEGKEDEFADGVILGGIIGGIIGGVLGAANYIQNLKRMNSILRDIKDIKQ